MVDLTKDRSDCCGCSACMSSCPRSAITLKPDAEGFLYPEIDAEKCNGCGICLKVCDFKKREVLPPNYKKVFALQHSSKDVLKTSTSGGAFTAISDVFLKRGAVVYGAFLDDNFDTYHIAAGTTEERDKLKGSKYVQSDMRNVFHEIKQLLTEDMEILFVGTPCQTAGLHSYLGKDYPKLFTMDFICHGTPSQMLFKEHIRFLESKTKKKAVCYQFRDKKFGWIHTESVGFADGTIYYSLPVIKFNALFHSDLGLRPACYSCKYANLRRYSDITIGDYWGVEKAHRIYDNRGTSLVIINSEKGQNVIDSLSEDCKLIPSDIKLAMQNGMKRPVKMPRCRDDFWQLFRLSGYDAATEKYAPVTARMRISTISKRALYTLHVDKLAIKMKSKLRK